MNKPGRYRVRLLEEHVAKFHGLLDDKFLSVDTKTKADHNARLFDAYGIYSYDIFLIPSEISFLILMFEGIVIDPISSPYDNAVDVLMRKTDL